MRVESLLKSNSMSEQQLAPNFKPAKGVTALQTLISKISIFCVVSQIIHSLKNTSILE